MCWFPQNPKLSSSLVVCDDAAIDFAPIQTLVETSMQLERVTCRDYNQLLFYATRIFQYTSKNAYSNSMPINSRL